MCLPVRLDNTTNSKLKGTKFVCHVFGLDDQNQKAFQMETAGWKNDFIGGIIALTLWYSVAKQLQKGKSFLWG